MNRLSKWAPGSLAAMLLLALGACGGGSSSSGTNTAATNAAAEVLQENTPYTLAANDRVRVNVFGFPDLSGEFALDGSGNLSMPLVGEIDANGLTESQLEQRIAQTYVEQDILRKAEVSIDILNYRPFYILGEVNNPSSYEYESGMTVLSAIALAGGFTYRANQNEFELQRGGSSAARVAVAPDTRILPGDIVHVNERWF